MDFPEANRDMISKIDLIVSMTVLDCVDAVVFVNSCFLGMHSCFCRVQSFLVS